MARVCIPDYEYQERIQRAAKMLRERGLDVMVVASTESDYANARYFSGFWPVFERAGVAISANGDAALLVGPESEVFGADFGKIEKVFVLLEFRESADPSYPELTPSTFNEVFKAIGVTGENIKIGLGSYVECTLASRVTFKSFLKFLRTKSMHGTPKQKYLQYCTKKILFCKDKIRKMCYNERKNIF